MPKPRGDRGINHPWGCFVLLLVAGFGLFPRLACAATTKSEYQVKAAFLHNFARFVEWPEHKLPAEDSPIVIGVLGDDPFGPSLDAITQKSIDRHRIVIKRFKGLTSDQDEYPHTEDMRSCHMLFVASDQRPYVERIAVMLRNDAVLTIGEQTDFIDRGGMVNFVVIDGKTCFEINLKSSKEANITIRSRLSRLAVRVIKE